MLIDIIEIILKDDDKFFNSYHQVYFKRFYRFKLKDFIELILNIFYRVYSKKYY